MAALPTLVPVGDLAVGDWTDEAGGTTNLWSNIDETSGSGTDYIRSTTVAAADAIFALSPPSDYTQWAWLSGCTLTLGMSCGSVEAGSPGVGDDTHGVVASLLDANDAVATSPQQVGIPFTGGLAATTRSVTWSPSTLYAGMSMSPLFGPLGPITKLKFNTSFTVSMSNDGHRIWIDWARVTGTYVPDLGTGIRSRPLSGGSTASATSATTASHTPTANALILVGITGWGTTSDPASVTGNGLTYDKILSGLNGGGSYIGLYRGMGASPSAGGITVTFATAPLGMTVAVAELIGVDTSGTNGSGAIVQSGWVNDSADPSGVTLSAFSNANNLSVSSYGGYSPGTTALKSTTCRWLGNPSPAGGGPSNLMVMGDVNDNSPYIDPSSAGAVGRVAVEVKATGPAGFSLPPPTVRSWRRTMITR